MSEIDFSLATTQEIIKELASRAKQKRKRNSAKYSTQKEFAAHIGMSYRSYQEFEISGKITLEKFIDVLRGLDTLEDISELLKIKDEELFEEHKNRRKTSSKMVSASEKIVQIPDVFE
jgi:transcriptional regulator with XRE-family HTH domain